MIKVATAHEMMEIDRAAINRYGIAGIELMERAGLACVDKINQMYSYETAYVLCGGGNNGGDGFVIARILNGEGRNVKAFLAVPASKLKGDAKTNYIRAKKAGVQIFPISKFLTSHSSHITRHNLIIDALFGTGLSKEIKSPLSGVINKVNSLSSPVLSVDIPSGISSDTGQIMGCAVKADHTVTFGLPKRGHLLYPGAEYTGRLSIADIGFPQKLLTSSKIKANLIQKADALSLMPQRPKDSHKGTYGHVLIIAGSRGKTGAALMTAKACLRTGAGLVTIGIPDSLVDTFQARVTEEMILPLPDKGNGTLSSAAVPVILKFLEKRGTVLAIGPGISNDKEISALVCELIIRSHVPIVIDADGLNAIAGKTSILKRSGAPVILTPHSGEMARLLNRKAEKLKEDRINTAISFAKKTKAYLVLKGAPTVIAAPSGDAFINSTGNPGMSTAGAGDVLTGMISAFLAQGLNPQKASILGVYMHGNAGDIAAEKKGEHSLIASDIIKAIPSAFRSIFK
ncbi:MAG: NAD(P)H-hydrate dehydratase [Thermodesulfovibrionia bacterium]|nr:NAD(P)H-hydrate dehydratase [Thermodesulfovibrionia bacterium]